ncbi:hypothetical protein HPB48_021122 [Haemaphysalis longicornis]|uniref:Caspase family p20 domain-containing protein n=1 Tax=Haemaphysalis longicornis TaxID=44386 RepID=A0A9J6GD95_HAELO|nr:hypothetical protein HPB48_021122 [Haemaphysalis longicornis]
MTRKPRGFCIIINIYYFEDRSAREDTKLDVERMEELFEALYFSVHSHSNLTADEIKKVLTKVAVEKQHRNAECLVVVLSSHGHKHVLYGTDGYYVDLQQIYDLFDNNNCPALQGKPKLFFIQACRGGTYI